MSKFPKPDRLWSRSEVLGKPSPVPRKPGVYAWYFREIPISVPTEKCEVHHDLTLLYVGISPGAPPRNGKRPSPQTLQSRIRSHYRGNAESSTLRLTLGCLLSDTLGTELRRVGSGKRRTFHACEDTLSDWMEQNAFVCWQEHTGPWLLEEVLIRDLSLPLNLDQNRDHPFHPILSRIRREAKAAANGKPIVVHDESNRGSA